MLHKKKRWTAAIHATGQPIPSALTPAPVTSPKNQRWPGHVSTTSVTPRQPSRYSTSPAFQMNQKLPPSTGYASDTLVPVPLSSSVPLVRPSSLDELPPSSQFPMQLPQNCPADTNPSVSVPTIRTDVPPGLLTAIAHSTGLLHQPGLLLQVLPQEYIEKYAKSLEKRMNPNKCVSDSTDKSADLIRRSGERLVPPNMSSSFQPSHHSCSSFGDPGHQTGFRASTTQNNLSSQIPVCRPSPIESTRIGRTVMDTRASAATSQNQVFSIPCTASFADSLPRNPLSSVEQHSQKAWSAVCVPPVSTSLRQQQLSNLDYSTISAVARAASLFNCSSGVNAAAAAALLQQWDAVNQVNLKCSGSTRLETSGHKSTVSPICSQTALSPPSVHAGCHDEASTSHIPPMERVTTGNVSDSQKCRTPTERLPQVVNRPLVPGVTSTTSELRRLTPKSTISSGFVLEGRMLPSASPTSPSSCETNKVCRTTLSWPPTDYRADPNISLVTTCRDRASEAADTRLSILQDAKMASLSVDWSSSTNSTGSNTTPAVKPQRARSSTSLTWPTLSVSEPSPPFGSSSGQSQSVSPHAYVQHNRCITAPSKDNQRSSALSFNLDMASPTAVGRGRQTTTFSDPHMNLCSVNSAQNPSSTFLGDPSLNRFTGLAHSPSKSTLADIQSLRVATSNLATNRFYANGSVSPSLMSFHSSPSNMINKTCLSSSTVSFGLDAEPAARWTTTPPVAPKLNSPISAASSSVSLSSELTAKRSAESIHYKNSESRSLMPLKKRLIQRYEADNVCAKPFASDIVQDGSTSVHLPNQSNTGSSVDLEYAIKIQKVDPVESRPSSVQSTGSWNVSTESVEKKSPPSALCTEQSKRTTGFKTCRKLPPNTHFDSDSGTRSVLGSDSSKSNVMKSLSRRDNTIQRSKSSGRVSKRIGSGSCPDPLVHPNENTPKRRSGVTNCSTLTTTAHQTGSSVSSRSSSSLRSGSAGDDTDADANEDSDATEREKQSTKIYTGHKTATPPDHVVSTNPQTPLNSHTLSDRIREPKRAAALAASAATAASAVGGVKRPRCSPSHSSSALKRRIHVGQDEDVSADGENSTSADDDASSVMTSESKNSITRNPVLDEFSAALIEDKWQFEELGQRLPGPPDLNALTNHSIHPTHSLEYYKQNRTPFVQLVSCNDPGLKQVPKCRACRQVKRSHFDASVNSITGEESGASDDDCKDKLGDKAHSSSTHGNDGHFKRPSGRNTQVDREKGGDPSVAGEPDRVRGDKPRSRKTQLVSPVSVFCRFWGFRKLVFNNRGVLKIAGFCQSNEASPADRSLWEMHHSVSPPLDASNAKYILERAGTLFCRLLRQELAVLSENRDREPVMSRGPGAPPKNGLRANPAIVRTQPTNVVAWKRPVKGVREMCDVCETTMFNTHWVCGKCGYSICVHCYEEARAKKEILKTESVTGSTPETTSSFREKAKGKMTKTRAGPASWASCTTTRQHHDPDRLLLTSLMPACTIGKLLHRVHCIARHYRIRLGCGCVPDKTESSGRCNTKLEDTSHDAPSVGENSLDLLADLALKRDYKDSSSSNKGSKSETDDTDISTSCVPHTWILGSGLTIPIPSSVGDSSSKEATNCPSAKYRVLQLHDPDGAHVLEAFQAEWQRNRPVVVSGCSGKFDAHLWSPHSFTEEFGRLRTTLVDCATSVELTRYPLRTFWDGFDKKSRRLVSKDGRPMCLKLKDWPTTDDFAELQPQRFSDLMEHLPMPSYTCRDGQLNLASRLSPFFVCPDLGPKLYMAYGTGVSRSIGTTNLHVDIADAINVLLYVGHPSDSLEESTANAEAVLNVMRHAQVDPVYVERALCWAKNVLGNPSGGAAPRSPSQCSSDNRMSDSQMGPPGALWHIFLPEDMPTLRRFLTQITEEDTGTPLEPGSDPIHDQLFYLDRTLLDRLHASTGILPCTLVQFAGDTVFIPAGAAHQVRNLNSCIKAAVDFVSPEHLPQCFQLIEEFRRLSSTHQNHEDKLQVKNMVFHAVKDALSVLATSSDHSNRSGSLSCEASEPGKELLAHKLFAPTLESSGPSCHVTTNASLLNEANERCCQHQSVPSANITTGLSKRSASPSPSVSDCIDCVGEHRPDTRPGRCRSTVGTEDGTSFSFSGRTKLVADNIRSSSAADGFSVSHKSGPLGSLMATTTTTRLPSPPSQSHTSAHWANNLELTQELGTKRIGDDKNSSV